MCYAQSFSAAAPPQPCLYKFRYPVGDVRIHNIDVTAPSS